ncbi:MAG: CBS domain-containing protein [Nitrospira sp.]|jgi:signal-transduction protein with cAMP-binding, CBS, and nucleotidyltransferase domain|nr:CBS domain-containing protein [Nitrospira sp. BO4]
MADKDDQQPKASHYEVTLVSHMMTPGVVQIPGDVSVTEAASLLERERMPCLLVKDTESRFGLMTPTDIVKKVVAQGLEPDDIEVRTIMTRPVQFIEYDRAMEEASTLMMSTGTPILIVTKQDQPVGVLTARDLVLLPKRCVTHISATISIMDGERVGAEHQVAITQLSHAGASVESPALLLPGTKVILSFCLSEAMSPLTIRGTVLNNTTLEHPPSTTRSILDTRPGVEIQFIDLSPADQSRIKAWVLTNLPQSPNLS